MKYLKILSVNLIIIGLFSCDPSEKIEPEKPLEGEVFLIKKIEDEFYKQLFYYDDENRLVRWMDFKSNKLEQIHDYEYLEDKKRRHSISVYLEGEKYVLSDLEVFDENYNPIHTFGIGISISNGNVDIEEEESDYSYNTTGAIEQWDCYMKNELVAFAKYKVSSNGNVESKQTQSLIRNAEQTETFEYDNQKHYSHFWTYGMGFEPINNNVIKYESTNNNGHKFSYTSTYEYNEMGLPIKEKRTFENGQIFTTIYEYERR